MSELKIKKAVHIAGFDYLRIASAFGVVWIHGSDTNSYVKSLQTLAAFAVPCFILMSVYLGEGSLFRNPQQGLAGFLTCRMKRLVPAYLTWSVAYMVLRYGKHHFITGTPLHVDWVAVLLFGGSSYQMWFVPALLLWTAVLAPLMLFAVRTDRPMALGIFLLLLSGAALWGGFELNMRITIPAGYEIFRYMIGQTGFIFLGIGCWTLFGPLAEPVRKPHVSAGSLGGLCLVLTATSLKLDLLHHWFTPFFSGSVFLMSLRQGSAGRSVMTKQLAQYAFGIYLAHAVFVEGFQAIAERAGIDIGSVFGTVAIIVGAFVSALALCMLLGMRKETRWLVA